MVAQQRLEGTSPRGGVEVCLEASIQESKTQGFLKMLSFTLHTRQRKMSTVHSKDAYYYSSGKVVVVGRRDRQIKGELTLSKPSLGIAVVWTKFS